MTTKTSAKNNRNVKQAAKATTTKATRKNATVAKPAAKEPKSADKKMSQIEAAGAILAKSNQRMDCLAMVGAMQVQGLWSTQGGATPKATLYASIFREINGNGKNARLRRLTAGSFTWRRENRLSPGAAEEELQGKAP